MTLATEGEVEIAEGTVFNLDECPDDWSPTAGITDDEIRWGTSQPRSGQLAAFGAIADGMQAYFDYVNENDPIDGKQLTLVIRDDAYEAGRTVANVEEMLETEDLFGFAAIIGTPNNLAVRPTLDEACVPEVMNGTGAPNWGDPANFPWTIGYQIAYNTEALLWCENIVSELGEGATVAGLFMNNDFGKAYQTGIEQFAEDGKIELVETIVHEATAPDIQNEMTTMIASDAQAFVMGSTAAFCPQSVSSVAGSAWRPLFYMSGTCANLASFFEPVKDAAIQLAAEGSGVRMNSWAKNFTDPQFAEDEDIILGNQILEDAGFSAAEGSYSTGVLFAYSMVEVMRDAVATYGELNRVTMMAAAWNANHVNPYVLDGIEHIVDGTNDAFFTEGAVIQQVTGDDAGNLTLESVTELLSIEGESGTFAG